MVCGEPECSGPIFPPGFEDCCGVFGPSRRTQVHSVDSPLGEAGGSKAGQKQNQERDSSPYSTSSSVDKVPQTPCFESESPLHKDVVENVVAYEEDLVETQITWDVGKTLGLRVSDDRAMVAALAKVQELQDFVLPRRRGRPRKNKGKSKD